MSLPPSRPSRRLPTEPPDRTRGAIQTSALMRRMMMMIGAASRRSRKDAESTRGAIQTSALMRRGGERLATGVERHR